MSFDDTETVQAAIDLRDSGLSAADIGRPGSTLSPTGRARMAGFEDVDVDGIVDSLEGVHGEQGNIMEDRSFQRFPELTLPGFGDELDDCGYPIPHGCDSCGKPVTLGRTCYRSQCPRCAPAWARRGTGNVVGSRSSYGAQILALRSYYSAMRREDIYYQHMTVSFREGYHVDGADDRLDALQIMKDEVKDVALELGFEGGIIAYHPFRVANDTPEEGDSRGEWKKLLFNGFAWTGVREQLDFGPHFHVVGVAPFVIGDDVTRIVEDETGVVIHRITEHNSNVSIFGETELAKVLSYVLSHVGLYQTPKGSTRGAVWRFGHDVNEITPLQRHEREMDYEARKVAPITLGLPYSSMVCTEDDVDDPMPVDEVSLEGGTHHDHTHAGASPYDLLSAPGSMPDDSLGSSTSSWTSSRSSPGWGSATWSPGGAGETFSLGGIRLSDGSTVPNPNDIPSNYLDVLEDATPQEIIEQFAGVTEDNVWEFRNEIRDAVGRDVCGGRLLRADLLVEHLADPEWREDADHLDELVDMLEAHVDDVADAPPNTPAKLLLRELRDNFDEIEDVLRIDRARLEPD